jgi:hypothetical protein
MATASSSSSVQPVIPKVDHGRVEYARVKRTPEGDIILDLPQENMPKEILPHVTVVTVTRNRRKFFPLAIDNWKRIYYPYDRLTWLIIDDSDDIKDGPAAQLKPLRDPRIQYYRMPPKEEGGKLVGHTVGYKRNFAMGLVKSDYVAMMDDDDFFYAESILSRICCLIFYGKECAYSEELGVYHINNTSSYVLEGFDDVPEGTLLFHRSFWERQKFGEGARGEGIQLVSGQENRMIKIPWYFNLVVLNHSTNTTGSGRNLRFQMKGAMKEKAAVSAPVNFYKKSFPESFKKALKELEEANKSEANDSKK